MARDVGPPEQGARRLRGWHRQGGCTRRPSGPRVAGCGRRQRLAGGPSPGPREGPQEGPQAAGAAPEARGPGGHR
eukprot:5237550-Lingulodinium_polyedra.AAC.1